MSTSMVDQETDTPESTSLSPVREGKASSAQTNASAKPSRGNQPVRSTEEEAALEAAMAERNAAKERHRQAKLAKKGGDESSPAGDASSVAPAASTSKGAERAAAAVANVVNSAAGEVVASPREKQPSPAKSPAKLLPPSAAQRKAQLEADAQQKRTEEAVFDSPDVGREKAG
jgi:hypothetical protein